MASCAEFHNLMRHDDLILLARPRRQTQVHGWIVENYLINQIVIITSNCSAFPDGSSGTPEKPARECFFGFEARKNGIGPGFA